MTSIHDLKRNMLKKRYGSCYAVYRSVDIDKLMIMWRDLNYLCELSTRTSLVPANKEFLLKKAIPAYNSCVERMRNKYPDIVEFDYYKPLTKEEIDRQVKFCCREN